MKGLSWRGTVLLAVPCLAPALLRIFSTGLTEPAGLLSDAGCGLLLLAVICWLPRWFRGILAAGWALFHILARELLLAVQRPPAWQDLVYLADPQFLANSTAGFHVAAPFYALALMLAVIPAFARYRCSRVALPAVLLSCALLLLGIHKPVSAMVDGTTSARYNPAHWLAVQAAQGQAGSQQGGVRLKVPAGLTSLDLSGSRLLPEQPARNVLIITLEGISWFYLTQLLESHDRPAETFAMEKLAGQLEGAMLVPDFTVHSHQTIRGLYALHCGDFSKLSFETPKAVELQLNPARAAECLPAVMAANGWQSHFLQGAPLQFMNKDRAMPMMGFQEVHGREWFGDEISTDFIWGAGDEDFFQGARRYISQLRQTSDPWLLSLLTVGTHQPFAASEEAVQKYGSRKIASVAALDQAAGDFLAWLREQGVLDDTLVIVTSDESHGSAGPDWHSSWGFCAVLAPGGGLPRIKPGSYGLVDIEASILDYFGLKQPDSILGRSLFRDYPAGRDMISYTAGKLRYQSAEGTLEECSADGVCTSFPETGLIGPRREGSGVASPERAEFLPALARLIDHSLDSEEDTRVLEFGHGDIRSLPEKVHNEWTDNLVGAQYLDFPEGSTVRVKIGLTALAAPEQEIGLRLTLRQFEQVAAGITPPAIPVLAGGQSANVEFEFHNDQARRAFSFHLVGEGRDARIRLDQFEISVIR